MLTKTLLALSLITGTFSIANYSLASNSDYSPQTIAQLPTSTTEYTGIVKTVDDIAGQITVRIATADIPSYGSGVIIGRDDNTYYVATVAHVFPEKDSKSYRIVTPDGESYELNKETIKKSDAFDLAIFSFTSEKDYTVATIGNYTVAEDDEQVVFVSGFAKDVPDRIITGGKAIQRERVSFRIKDAYSLVDNGSGLLYSNLSYNGMGGAAVLDSEGRLIGINAGAENELYFDEEGNSSEIALGFSLGIPATDLLAFLQSNTELKTEWLQTTSNPAPEVNESDFSDIETQLLTVEAPKDDTNLIAWMNYGNRLWRYKRYGEAIDAFSKVIIIDPSFDRAYYVLGLAYQDNKQYPQAVTALTKATQIAPKPYFYWRGLASSYVELNRLDEAISAYQQAIDRNSEDFVLYIEYGNALAKAQRYQEAIASFNKAVSLNPDRP